MFWDGRWDMKTVQQSGILYLLKLCKGYRIFSTPSYPFCLLYIIIFKKELIVEFCLQLVSFSKHIGFGLRIGKPLTKLSSFFSLTVPMMNTLVQSVAFVGNFCLRRGQATFDIGMKLYVLCRHFRQFYLN